MSERVCIVGGGQAAANCAQTLRQRGFVGTVTIVSDEAHPPYERPPLSKDLLAGRSHSEEAFIRPQAWYAENNIRLELCCRVANIEPGAKLLTLCNGGTLPYDALVIATGARPRQLPLVNVAKNVFYLRTIDDSLALRSRIRQGHRLVVIGAGFIGLEVAATAREIGAVVTVVEIAAYPMERVAPPELGQFYADLHRRHGINLLTNMEVIKVDHTEDGINLGLNSGATCSADTLVVGVGVVPNSEIAAEAGLEVDNGVAVNALGQTSNTHIWAVGDCAAFWHPALGRRLRLEAWQHAQNHAIAVAGNIMGDLRPYTETPWFWSDQYGINLQIVGAPLVWDEIVWRGNPSNGQAILFQLKDHAVVGAAALGLPREVRFLRSLVSSGRCIRPRELADPGRTLKSILNA